MQPRKRPPGTAVRLSLWRVESCQTRTDFSPFSPPLLYFCRFFSHWTLLWLHARHSLHAREICTQSQRTHKRTYQLFYIWGPDSPLRWSPVTRTFTPFTRLRSISALISLVFTQSNFVLFYLYCILTPNYCFYFPSQTLKYTILTQHTCPYLLSNIFSLVFSPSDAL